MGIDYVRMLSRYNAWANQQIFGAVSRLFASEAKQKHEVVLRDMVYTLNHVYVADLIWQAHLENREHGFTARNTKDCPTLEALWASQQKIDDWYIAWSEDLTAKDLNQQVSFTFVGGNPGLMRRAEILFHVVNHTTYHRGYVSHLFRQISEKPPSTDLSVYIV